MRLLDNPSGRRIIRDHPCESVVRLPPSAGGLNAGNALPHCREPESHLAAKTGDVFLRAVRAYMYQYAR